jgi:hypothetical protein
MHSNDVISARWARHNVVVVADVVDVTDEVAVVVAVDVDHSVVEVVDAVEAAVVEMMMGCIFPRNCWSR